MATVKIVLYVLDRFVLVDTYILPEYAKEINPGTHGFFY